MPKTLMEEGCRNVHRKSRQQEKREPKVAGDEGEDWALFSGESNRHFRKPSEGLILCMLSFWGEVYSSALGRVAQSRCEGTVGGSRCRGLQLECPMSATN